MPSFPTPPIRLVTLFGLIFVPTLALLVLAKPGTWRTQPGLIEDSERRLKWLAELPAPAPAWPDQARLAFDRAVQPLLLDEYVIHGCTRTDAVIARDRATGEVVWRFTTEGPVRLAPVGWDGIVFAASDDGHLYALEADTGALLWKMRGGPSDRKLLGNERLISAWPARGGPVVVDEGDDQATVYFAAGVWPFMGIFLHSLDARTGKLRWSCDGEGARYQKQPHNTDSFAGVAPQGSLAVAGDYLVVPGGRSVPAVFDRTTGQFVHFRLAEYGKSGGSDVRASGEFYICGDSTFAARTGDEVFRQGEPSLLTEDRLFAWEKGTLTEYDLKAPILPGQVRLDRKKSPRLEWNPQRIGSLALPTAPLALAQQGDRLFVALPHEVLAFALPLQPKPGLPVWRASIPGTPSALVAEGSELVVSTRQGGLYCFGSLEETNPNTHRLMTKPAEDHPENKARAAGLLRASGQREGYALLHGDAVSGLARELVRQSDLRVVLVVPEAMRAAELRLQARREGILGDRLTILTGLPESLELPAYFASLIVLDDPAALDRGFTSLRPYGGVMVLPGDGELPQRLPTGTNVRSVDGFTLLTRPGALPGAGNWTHEQGDAASSRRSRDSIVKAPLGMLWFGGPSNEGVLPRHGHGPQPHVIDGRCIIEGVDTLRATDIYTGRLLWEARLPGLGRLYDNLAHQPGANASGGNYVSLADGIYVVYGRECLRLDPATGTILSRFAVPSFPGVAPTAAWSCLHVTGDTLIGGTLPDNPTKSSKAVAPSASKYLFALDRHTGKFLWRVGAKTDGWRHNSLCSGDGKLYAIERPSNPLLWGDKETKPKGTPRVVAFDLTTGKELWVNADNVFGTALAYSDERKILVEFGRVARDSLADEPKGLRAFDAVTGKQMWKKDAQNGPVIVHGDRLLCGSDSGKIYSLLTGVMIQIPDPLTGEPMDWTWARQYGCNMPMGSEHLITFRSGAAGFYDLCNAGGTGNLGGFRSGCTNNLIVAGGLLVVPDYTRTCSCSYQNQCSVALMPMADADLWTFRGGSKDIKGPVRRLGLLLGGPGNRKADNGTLWLEYPPTGSPGPVPSVRVTPAEPTWFRRHTSQVQGQPAWVGASGAIGLEHLAIDLAPKGSKPRRYTVKLYFVEPEAREPGERILAIALNGKTVLPELDIVAETETPRKVLVKEFNGIEVTETLEVALKALTNRPTVLSGVEVLAE